MKCDLLRVPPDHRYYELCMIRQVWGVLLQLLVAISSSFFLRRLACLHRSAGAVTLPGYIESFLLFVAPRWASIAADA